MAKCMYGHCRARNLCTDGRTGLMRSHCVGKRLFEKDDTILEGGTMHTASKEEKELYNDEFMDQVG